MVDHPSEGSHRSVHDDADGAHPEDGAPPPGPGAPAGDDSAPAPGRNHAPDEDPALAEGGDPVHLLAVTAMTLTPVLLLTAIYLWLRSLNS